MRPSEKDVRRFLRSYQRAIMKLDTLKDEREMIKAMAMSMTANMNGESMPKGGISDKVSKGALALMEIDRQIDAQAEALKIAREAVWDIVDEVEDYNIIWGRCLHYRYIRGYKPFVTALEMKYETNSERKIHARACEYVADLLENRPELLCKVLKHEAA